MATLFSSPSPRTIHSNLPFQANAPLKRKFESPTLLDGFEFQFPNTSHLTNGPFVFTHGETSASAPYSPRGSVSQELKGLMIDERVSNTQSDNVVESVAVPNAPAHVQPEDDTPEHTSPNRVSSPPPDIPSNLHTGPQTVQTYPLQNDIQNALESPNELPFENALQRAITRGFTSTRTSRDEEIQRKMHRNRAIREYMAREGLLPGPNGMNSDDAPRRKKVRFNDDADAKGGARRGNRDGNGDGRASKVTIPGDGFVLIRRQD